MKTTAKKAWKTVLIVLVAVVVLWAALALTDYALVANENKPIFCVNDTGYTYVGDSYETYRGLGYAFVLVEHPVSGKREYIYSLFGLDLYNNFTNEPLPIAVN